MTTAIPTPFDALDDSAFRADREVAQLCGKARFVNRGQVLAHAATAPLRPSTNFLNR